MAFRCLLDFVLTKIDQFGIFWILAGFVFVDIGSCLLFTWITDDPLVIFSNEFWLNSLNHFVSFVLVWLVLTVGLAPLRDRFATVSSELKETNRKNKGISEVLRGHLDWQFEDWGLTASERDVAILSLKGLSIREVAEFRTCSEGTVKAHLNAIFRKAKVGSRTELLATCLESFVELGATTPTDLSAKVPPQRHAGPLRPVAIS